LKFRAVLVVFLFVFLGSLFLPFVVESIHSTAYINSSGITVRPYPSVNYLSPFNYGGGVLFPFFTPFLLTWFLQFFKPSQIVKLISVASMIIQTVLILQLSNWLFFPISETPPWKAHEPGVGYIFSLVLSATFLVFLIYWYWLRSKLIRNLDHDLLDDPGFPQKGIEF
jgi:hypothetical protein